MKGEKRPRPPPKRCVQDMIRKRNVLSARKMEVFSRAVRSATKSKKAVDSASKVVVGCWSGVVVCLVRETPRRLSTALAACSTVAVKLVVSGGR